MNLHGGDDAPGGIAAAALAVLILASYPVATRAGLSTSIAPDTLLLMRFGVGALLLLPFLLLRLHEIPLHVWRAGIPLALCQGAGMAALVIYGLQQAPASHAAALGPGATPAWIALLGLLLFARRPAFAQLLGAGVTLAGVCLLVWGGASSWNASMLAGDAMFLSASALGALYLLQLRRSGIGAFDGAVVVTMYSAAVVLPVYLWHSAGSLPSLREPGMLAQIAWQGVLIGFVALVATNHAIAKLGCERAGALFALVPVLSAILGYAFLGEVLTPGEALGILAISSGVAIAAMPRRGGRLLRAGIQAGRPAA